MIEVIIFLIVLSLAGSILWVLPSPSQRRKAALRSKALTLGFSVRFCDKQFTSIVDGEEYLDPLICYASRPVQSKGQDFEITLMKVWKDGEYIWRLDSLRNLSEQTEALVTKRVQDISSIQGVSFFQAGYRFYWLEAASTDELEKVAATLDELWGLINADSGKGKKTVV